MSSIIITYNSNTIAEVPNGKTATLKCEGRIPATDIVARFEVDGKVMFDGKLFVVPAKYSITLQCADRRMMSDIVMMTGNDIGEYGCVLGSARLGSTLLGVAERLDAPTIFMLSDEPVVEKLATPSIALIEVTA